MNTHSELLELGKNDIDSEGTLKLLKGTRGLALFTEQRVKYNYSNKDGEVLFANKVLTHQQAVELRDYLNTNYPLGE